MVEITPRSWQGLHCRDEPAFEPCSLQNANPTALHVTRPVGNLQGAETMLCGGAINGPRQKRVRAKIDPGRGNTYPKLVGRLVGSMDLFLWKIETGNPGSPRLPWKMVVMVVSCRVPWIQFLDFSGNGGFPQPASSSLALGFGDLPASHVAISRRLVVQETLPFLYCLHIPHLCLSAGWLTNSHTLHK